MEEVIKDDYIDSVFRKDKHNSRIGFKGEGLP